MKIGIYVIIGVKNQEREIDGVLRGLLFKIMYGKEESIKKVIVTDLDSTDGTMKKLKRFKKENEYIEVATWKKCKDIMDLVEEERNT